ncbi:hypothetical protein [Pontibacter flavimaris]|uniref:Uncharacterized protein n=1 Tax=Pontibacter flavimaris TaxID=1797110 RepID=A0A1Q5P846_9BACT|nr:hypothetical protein [Pontibacter flavimaris]OKL38417.1 hypothetical protein A3841_06770 [Pontibacter flavimaris]
MKNVLLVIAAFLISTASFAQSPFKLSREAEERCTQITRAMAQELRLNELGYIKLKELNRERMLATQEILSNHSNDTHLLEQKLEELAASYDQNVTSFLNSNQLQAYANYKNQPAPSGRFVAVTNEE